MYGITFRDVTRRNQLCLYRYVKILNNLISIFELFLVEEQCYKFKPYIPRKLNWPGFPLVDEKSQKVKLENTLS